MVFVRARCTLISQMSSRRTGTETFRASRRKAKKRRESPAHPAVCECWRSCCAPAGKMGNGSDEDGGICEGISGRVPATSDRVIIRAVRHGTGKAREGKVGQRFPQESPLIEQTSSLNTSPEIKPAGSIHRPEIHFRLESWIAELRERC